MGILMVSGRAGGRGEVGEDWKCISAFGQSGARTHISSPFEYLPATCPQARAGAFGSVCWAGFLPGF